MFTDGKNRKWNKNNAFRVIKYFLLFDVGRLWKESLNSHTIMVVASVLFIYLFSLQLIIEMTSHLLDDNSTSKKKVLQIMPMILLQGCQTFFTI